MTSNKEEESQEKIKEIGYIRLNFQNKLRILASRQNSILKNMSNKLDNQKLKKIREQIER